MITKQNAKIRKSPTRLPGEFWGVTTYFNPTGSPVRRDNLLLFSQRVRRQGLKLLIVEAARHNAPFETNGDTGDIIVHRRTDAILWQKERLLNIGFDNLPESCDKVAWLDGDILFENPDWVKETSGLLETYVAVQPFEAACWLPCGDLTISEELPRGLGEGHRMPAMACCLAHRSDWRRALADYFEHGHTGFAWAIRRSVLDRTGLYDRHVLGGGDVIIAHALYGDRDFQRGLNVYCRNLSKKELACIADWSLRFSESIQNSVYYTRGRVLHLWHGGISNRNYMDRLKILKEIGYDPDRHVKIDENGCWCWNLDSPVFHDQVRNYFGSRFPGGGNQDAGKSEELRV